LSSFSVNGQGKRKRIETVAKIATQQTLTPRQIAERVSKSAVLIVTQDADGEPLAQGSGFFYSVPVSSFVGNSNSQMEVGKTNLVATNLHVFKRAWQGYIKTPGDGATYKIKQIVGIDLVHDLCVLEVQGISNLPLMLGNSNQVAVGDDIYAVGNPKGLEGSFSKGIVSSIRQKQGLIQIDAAISSGSSGGAIVNNRGEVIGIAVSSLSSGQNLNFAIPSNYLAQLPLTWQAPVNAAGALALSSKEQDGLSGPVQVVITKQVEVDNSKDTPVEPEPVLSKRDEYNEMGNSIKLYTYGENGKVRMEITSEHDERGFRSYVYWTFPDGRKGGKRYTDAENLALTVNSRSYSITREDEYTSSNNLKVKQATTYDRNGNETEDVRRVSDGRILKTVTKYDDEGRKIEVRMFANGALDLVRQFNYKIDRYGNWIRQTELLSSPQARNEKPIPVKVIYREITYY
jgi:hypothetical protein